MFFFSAALARYVEELAQARDSVLGTARYNALFDADAFFYEPSRSAMDQRVRLFAHLVLSKGLLSVATLREPAGILGLSTAARGSRSNVPAHVVGNQASPSQELLRPRPVVELDDLLVHVALGSGRLPGRCRCPPTGRQLA